MLVITRGYLIVTKIAVGLTHHFKIIGGHGPGDSLHELGYNLYNHRFSWEIRSHTLEMIEIVVFLCLFVVCLSFFVHLVLSVQLK